MKRAAIFGMGAIGRSLAADWHRNPPASWHLAAVCGRRDKLQAFSSPDVPVLDDCSAMLDLSLDAVIEVAGHAAVRDWGVRILEKGIDLFLLSVGALADPGLHRDMMAAAAESGAHIIVPSGALGGFDALKALVFSGPTEVMLRSIKPVAAWAGTPAEAVLGSAFPTETVMIFEGSAREAAQLFPKNSNLAASVALAGVGFDETRVSLYADPAATGNRSILEARSPACTLTVELAGQAEPDNPKSSAVVRSSVLAALERSEAALRID